MQNVNLDVVEKYEVVVEKEFNGEEVRVVSSKQMADDMGTRHSVMIQSINNILGKLFENDEFIENGKGKMEVIGVQKFLNSNPDHVKQGFVIFDGEYTTKQNKKLKCYYMNDIAYEVILNNMQGKEKEKLARLLYFKKMEAIAKQEKKLDKWDLIKMAFESDNSLTSETALLIAEGKRQYLELNKTKEELKETSITLKETSTTLKETEETLEQTESELQEALPSAVMFKLVDKTRTFYPKDLELVLEMGKFKVYNFMRAFNLVNQGDTRPTQQAINNGLAMWDNRTKSPVLTVNGLISLMNFISPAVYQQHLAILASL